LIDFQKPLKALSGEIYLLRKWTERNKGEVVRRRFERKEGEMQ
jgi:hypothetical protein